MGSLVYQQTTHSISNADFTFMKIAPTNGDPTTRKLTIMTVADTVEVVFTQDEFDLFKAIAREY